MTSAIEPVVWVRDGECNACSMCQCEFTFFNRRHHCRICGLIFCHQCCSTYLQVSFNSSSSPESKRCCMKCSHNLIANANLSPQRPLCLSTEDYVEGQSFKMYSIKIPADIKPQQVLKVSLDERVYSLVLPPSVCPGDTIHVKTMQPAEKASAEVVESKERVSLVLEFENNSNNDCIKCSACTFLNRSDAFSCAMCQAVLLDNSVV